MEFPRRNNAVQQKALTELSLLTVVLILFSCAYYSADNSACLPGECIFWLMIVVVVRHLVFWLWCPCPAQYFLVTNYGVFPARRKEGRLSKKESAKFVKGIMQGTRAYIVDILGNISDADLKLMENGTVQYKVGCFCSVIAATVEIRKMLARLGRFKHNSIYERRTLLFLIVSTSRFEHVNSKSYRSTLNGMRKIRGLGMDKGLLGVGWGSAATEQQNESEA